MAHFRPKVFIGNLFSTQIPWKLKNINVEVIYEWKIISSHRTWKIWGYCWTCRYLPMDKKNHTTLSHFPRSIYICTRSASRLKYKLCIEHQKKQKKRNKIDGAPCRRHVKLLHTVVGGPYYSIILSQPPNIYYSHNGELSKLHLPHFFYVFSMWEPLCRYNLFKHTLEILNFVKKKRNFFCGATWNDF